MNFNFTVLYHTKSSKGCYNTPYETLEECKELVKSMRYELVWAKIVEIKTGTLIQQTYFKEGCKL